jgi:hypothetical protein
MRDRGSAWLTTWVVMRLNSLVRLNLFFWSELSISLDTFRAVGGGVLGIEQEFDLGSHEVGAVRSLRPRSRLGEFSG